ncbi:hypothetical protein [Ornithinibacillus caprae]|nr:hypothetical protein [Ornithinibacillus caprae]
MPTLSIKMPLFEPTNIKQEMYETMQHRFSESCNLAINIKKETPK